MNGVGVNGRNGVGWGSGWTIQPLQEDNNRMIKRAGIMIFIFSPHFHCIPLTNLSIDPKSLGVTLRSEDLQLPAISPAFQFPLICWITVP